MPNLSHEQIYIPFRNTTGKLRPLDTEIFASVKLHRKRFHLDHAVEIYEVGVNDTYRDDILAALR